MEANCFAAGNIIKFFVMKRSLSCRLYGGKKFLVGERRIEEASEQLHGEFPGGCFTAHCYDSSYRAVTTLYLGYKNQSVNT